MVFQRRLPVLLVLVAAIAAANGSTRVRALQDAPQPEVVDTAGVTALLDRLQDTIRAGSPDAFTNLLTPSADRARAQRFAADEIKPGATRAVVTLDERSALTTASPVDALRLIVDTFTEFGNRARITTLQLDARYERGVWGIAAASRLTSVDKIVHLTLNTSKEFAAKNFVVKAEDIELTLADGFVFTVDTDQGVTGLVMSGHGELRFHPAPDTEKGQVKIFCGSETLDAKFDAAFVRVGSFEAHADPSTLVPRPVDPRDVTRANEVFRAESVKSFGVDVGALSPESWSLLPGADDFLAEIRTKKYDTLTYSRSSFLPEDISFFDRRRERNIAIYPSVAKLAARGRFYSEDDQVGYDVLDYEIDVRFSPARLWIDGQTAIHLQIRGEPTAQLMLRLADPLTVRSIESDRFGRLFGLRVKDQNALLISLPALVMPDTDLTLTITYAGRLPPQPANQETIALAQGPGGPGSGSGSATGAPPSSTIEQLEQRALEQEQPRFLRTEPTYLYSNRDAWYPQSLVSDYATARLRVTVPAELMCVSSGEPSPDSPTLVPAIDSTPAAKIFSFAASRPVRYLSFVVSRFTPADRLTIAFDRSPQAQQASLAKHAPAIAGENDGIDISVLANPHDAQQAQSLGERAADVAQFYESIIGDSPYQSFSVALVESVLPGGHSPAYFAVLDQPLPNAPVTWRDDPAAFMRFPEFFLAHELAHQWWGQAIGWRNYHEQWLSEGFAQYFAALYAQHERGDDTFVSILRQMRKWSMDESDQGPVYFGYRIGHIRGDSRAFRAIVYDKGAMVLHMLRRLVGDDAFFKGLRRFYAAWRFEKASTDDLRRAMEAESGQPLSRFFDRWIYGDTLPHVSFASHVESDPAGDVLVVRFDQSGDIFDMPVTLTLNYSGRHTDLVVRVTDRTVEQRIPLTGKLRSVDVNEDGGTLADIKRVH